MFLCHRLSKPGPLPVTTVNSSSIPPRIGKRPERNSSEETNCDIDISECFYGSITDATTLNNGHRSVWRPFIGRAFAPFQDDAETWKRCEGFTDLRC